MKRKVLKIGVIIAFACFGMVAVADTTVITAPPLGEGGGYVPENCTSYVSCAPDYTTLTTPYSGKVYCCSRNEPGVTGQAKY